MGDRPPNYISILPVVALCPLLVFLSFHSLHCLGFTLSMSSHHIWFFENSWPLLFFLSLFNPPPRGHRPEASWLILTKMCFKDVGIQFRVVCSLCTNSSPLTCRDLKGSVWQKVKPLGRPGDEGDEKSFDLEEWEHSRTCALYLTGLRDLDNIAEEKQLQFQPRTEHNTQRRHKGLDEGCDHCYLWVTQF